MDKRTYNMHKTIWRNRAILQTKLVHIWSQILPRWIMDFTAQTSGRA